LLIHICCSVDSHYFIKKLKELYPNKELVGYFYNPNIHPYSEYLLRYNDVKRSCDKYNVRLIDGGYNMEEWFKDTKGLEEEPEKGKRCTVCFEHRFEHSAKESKRLGIKEFTSTLLMSPKKSIETLSSVGQEIAKQYDLNFLSFDFRKSNGTQEQFKLAKDDKLYHQNYCGCMFALKKQRQIQNKVDVELFKNISNTTEPNSIEEKIDLYNQIVKLEKENIDYELARVSFKNYRLLQGGINIDNKDVNSYILSFSFLPKEFSKTKIKFIKNDIIYLTKDNIKIVDLEYINNILKTNIKSISNLVQNPLTKEQEYKLRKKIDLIEYSTSPIFIIDECNNICKNSKVIVKLKSIIYDDVKEILIQ
jgi:predicted adenine nucleotide alpha hydrolase (AANH) superfamily ATPase